MLKLCFKKAMRDLWSQKGRTFLVLIAMIIGIVGVGSVLNTRAILSREMDANYMKTNPASATITLKDLSSDEMQKVREMPQIQEVEARRTISARIVSQDKIGKRMALFVIQDFEQQKLNTFKPEKGKWPPAKGEILIERAAADMIDEKIGDDLHLKVSGLKESTLRIVGTLHAPDLPPAWMEGIVYGFISVDTYEAMGGKDGLNELKFQVSNNQMDKKYIETVAAEVKNRLEQMGKTIVGMEIPNPGRHPHARQMDTLLFLLGSFGILTLILSAIIVASMISAILSQQIRQIGIMKAVGGKNGQIAHIYLSIVVFLGMIALIIAVPLAILAGRGYATFAANILNFEIYDASVPIQILLIQILIGICLPLLTAVFSIVKGSRITVREAIQDYGVSLKKTGKKGKEKSRTLLHGFSRPMLISLRNTFRKKGRLIFTLCVLSLGGALFITAMNVSSSMNTSTMGLMKSFQFDTSVSFSKAYDKKSVEETIGSIQGVKGVEVWGGTKAAIMKTEGLTGDNFSILAIPPDTGMLAPIKPNQGQWLRYQDENAIVINQMVLSMEPGLKLGDTLQLRILGKEYPFRVIGIVDEILSEPKGYVNQSYYQKVIGQLGMRQSAMVAFDEALSKEGKEKLNKKIETELLKQGYDLNAMDRLTDIQARVDDHLVLLAAILIAMSFLGVIVGGMGLSTTIGVNVLERTREIGVMRAIGAPTKSVFRIIVGEGTLIGLLSWGMASVLAIPFSMYISRYFGDVFFDTPLKFSISPWGILIWLVLSMVFSALASLYPARKASMMSVRESLAYE